MMTVRSITAVVSMAVSGLVALPATSAVAGRDAPPAVSVWVTTANDRTMQLDQQPSVLFGTEASTHQTIVVDPETTYQSVDGFGASLTDSSAAVLFRLPQGQRDEVMRSLFDPDKGIGVSVLRQPIGSSDFTAEDEHYTYDDVAPGRTDFLLRRFSIAHDEAQILPLLRQAKQLNPNLKIIASPWSMPAWMKTGDSLIGGRLKDRFIYYLAYAAYLAKFVAAYRDAGVPIDYLTVQNEPQNRTPNGYPGTDMPVAQQAKLIAVLGPLLRLTSPRTKILGYDHNWAMHPNDIANTPPGEEPETDYAADLLSSTAARWIAGTAFHCYFGDASAQTALHERFPHKGIWFTECSGSHGPADPPAKFYQETLEWHARNIMIGVTRNWSKTAINWNIALDERGGPHLGGCDTCTGLVTVNDDGTVTRNAEYYTIGHLSKFVRPGAVRIASTSFGTTGWNGQIQDVAFRNPDGSTALIVHNQHFDVRTFAVSVGGRTFVYTLPARAVATFTWPASDALVDNLHPLDIRGATATATAAPDDAVLAIDADASTRWSSGQAQTPGLSLTIDLGQATTFRRIAIDAGGNLGDYARGWRLEVSSDRTNWHVAAAGVGTGQLENVDVPETTARYLRISTTQSVGNWWSIADIRLYA
jgi:glucosylceramidase